MSAPSSSSSSKSAGSGRGGRGGGRGGGAAGGGAANPYGSLFDNTCADCGTKYPSMQMKCPNCDSTNLLAYKGEDITEVQQKKRAAAANKNDAESNKKSKVSSSSSSSTVPAAAAAAPSSAAAASSSSSSSSSVLTRTESDSRQMVRSAEVEEEPIQDEFDDDDMSTVAVSVGSVSSTAAAAGSSASSAPAPLTKAQKKKAVSAAAARRKALINKATRGSHVEHDLDEIKGLGEQTVREIQAAIQSLKQRRAATVPSSSTVDPIIMCIHAEKGGVGKTTTSAALAFALADCGVRVLLIDGDSQRSLSGYLLSGELRKPRRLPDGTRQAGQTLTELIDEDLSASYPTLHALPRTLYDQMERVSTAGQITADTLQPAVTFNVRPNLFFVPGHRSLNAVDARITQQQMLARGGFNSADNVSGLAYHAIMKTAKHSNAEFVILDLNPSVGALNSTIIMTSHYLITPCIADYYSAEIVAATTQQLRDWQVEMAERVRRYTQVPKAPFPMPNHFVKYMGYILNRFTVRQLGPIINGLSTEGMAYNERFWADQVDRNCVESMNALAPELAVPLARHAAISRRPLLGLAHDYGKVGDLSLYFHVPVSHLRDDQLVDIDADGHHRDLNEFQRAKYLRQVQWWKLVYLNMIQTIVNLCD